MIFAADPGGVRRERLVALAGLIAVTALAWLYLWVDAARMEPMAGGMEAAATAGGPWDAGTLLPTFVMWSVMMAGMMLPSAAPAILLYGTMARRNRASGSALPSVWVFAGGYLAVWTLFSLAVTLLQAGLETGGLLTAMMVSASPWLSGGLLVAAGVYQWLPVKAACLEKCRSPLQLFLFRWRPGAAGAFRMGVEHGLFCVGCCWALMLLLFAAGVMNLLWVAVIAAFVFVEKLLPASRLVGRLAGVGLAGAGLGLMLSAA